MLNSEARGSLATPLVTEKAAAIAAAEAAVRCLHALGRCQLFSEKLLQEVSAHHIAAADADTLALYIFECGRMGLRCKRWIGELHITGSDTPLLLPHASLLWFKLQLQMLLASPRPLVLLLMVLLLLQCLLWVASCFPDCGCFADYGVYTPQMGASSGRWLLYKRCPVPLFCWRVLVSTASVPIGSPFMRVQHLGCCSW